MANEMKGTSVMPYFYFVVVADTQPWPYYAEVPYTAWPDEEMYYNSNGDCQQPYDRTWSYLDVMNWETHENIIVCDAKGFSANQTEQTRLMLSEELDVWGNDDSLLSLAHVYQLLLYLLDVIPREYCVPGNVIVSSFRCGKPHIAAVVARLFTRRLQSDVIWDGQIESTLTVTQLADRYLCALPVGESDALADEVRRVFSEGERWHRAHPERDIGWWKTLAQVRQVLENEQGAR
jgi:hypothetical protein